MPIDLVEGKRKEHAMAAAVAALADRPLADIARCAAVTPEPGGSDDEAAFSLSFLMRPVQVTWPGGVVTAVEGGAPLKHAEALLVLHYLAGADGAPMADRWVAFRELPDALAYGQACTGRVEPSLVAVFGTDPEAFHRGSRALGASPLEFGDASYAFQVLPRVALAIVLYEGDDEFPPAVNVLFDAAAGHYLPTEDLAILGGIFVGRLIVASMS